MEEEEEEEGGKELLLVFPPWARGSDLFITVVLPGASCLNPARAGRRFAGAGQQEGRSR